LFVKTDGSTPNSGDSMNPIGGRHIRHAAVEAGPQPDRDASNFNGRG
jgi:hypothetical protein